jgi:NAD(P)-dependent dehydrogenase (short-subunit alcohol dehydrogenase family)
LFDPPFPTRSTFAVDLFAGGTALVTGASRGIGRAIALAFARAGANVVLASRTMDDLRAVALEVEALGGQALCVETNIRDVQAVDRLAELSLDRFEAVDFVVNNAGGQFQANPFDITDNGWRAVVDLNLNGTWNVCSRFMPHLMERQQGSIVNIVHRFVFERGAPMFAHSGAARAGVVNLTRSLAPYLEARNVTINAVAPGDVMSASAAANYGYTEEEWRSRPTRTRYGEPDDIANIVLFLCSPAARMINGSVIVADAAATQTNWPSVDEMLDSVSGADDV